MALGPRRCLAASHPYPYVPVEVSLDLARLVSEHETLRDAVRALSASEPEVVAYACTSGSFVGGLAGERAMCEAMTAAGEVPSLTTSGALLEALDELGAGRIALVTPVHGIGHPGAGGVSRRSRASRSPAALFSG